MTKEHAYFPVFIDLSNRKAVIIGAGTIGARRTAVLAEFMTDITVVAPQADEKVEKLAEEGRITLKRREYEPADLDGADLVIAATGNALLDEKIQEACRKRKIPVNVISDKDKCDFHFPGIVKRGSMVAGVNAGGSDHRKARLMREAVEKALDDLLENENEE